MRIAWIAAATDFEPGSAASQSTIASVRYRVIMPAAALRTLGHDVTVGEYAPGQLRDAQDVIRSADVLVFRRNYEHPGLAEQLMAEAVAAGKPAIFDLSDDRLDGRVGPHLKNMIAGASAVVTMSPSLRDRVGNEFGKPAEFVGDPVEGPRGEARWSPASDRCKALWFGHPVNLPSLFEAFPALLAAGKTHPMELRIVTERVEGIERDCKSFNARHRDALALRFVPWSLEETWRSLEWSDVVIIPAIANHPRSAAKSANRMAESLWAGRFVVANPVPSYREFADWAWVGDDLAEGIGWLSAHAEEIPGRIRAAQAHVAANFSASHFAGMWLKVAEAQRSGAGGH